MSTPDWATNCDEVAQTDHVMIRMLTTNAHTSCDLLANNADETALARAKLPADVAGWQYAMSVHCGAENKDEMVYVDTSITHVGPAVIAFFITGTGQQPASCNFAVVNKLVGRAKAATAA